MSKEYDVIIIGGGVSGLHAGAILAKNNYKVCVLEKHSKLGGGLHNFSRNGTIYETGIHYTSSLGPDMPLGKLYNYLGIIDTLKFKVMDQNGYDVILRGEDKNEYPIAADRASFIKNLVKFFPDAKEELEDYYDSLIEESEQIPYHNLKNIGLPLPMDLYTQSVSERLEKTIKDKKLRDVLAGNSYLYAGQKEITPWSVHLLTMSSYAQGAYRFINGSQQLANALRKVILDNEGAVEKNAEVISCAVEDKVVQSVRTKNDVYTASHFISSVHPQVLLPMLPEGSLRKIYKERVMEMENLPSCFALYIELKPNTFPFYNNNFYYHDQDKPWYNDHTVKADWPSIYYLATPPHTENDQFATAVHILTYMDYEEVQEWEDSWKKARSEDYYDFKKRKADIVLEKVFKRFPHLKDCIEKVEAATPLTLRDYLNSPQGGLYGVQKDARNLQKSQLNHLTKIKNLYLTGQNTASHGLVGSVMSALISCGALLNIEELFKELNNG